MNLWQRFTARMQPTVFLGSAGLVVALAIYGGVYTEHAEDTFEEVRAFLVDNFGWFYILSASGFFVFICVLPVTRLGNIKLGKDEDEPEFSRLGWFAMLFSAGMGIGLLFWAVAEPMSHWVSPPRGVEPRSDEAMWLAMRLTFYHWGIHPWAIYVILGIGIGLMHFRYDLPLAPRSIFYPLLRERIYGPIGHVVDILCTVGTLIGVAASLGLGSKQINAGLDRLFQVGLTQEVRLAIIGAITAVALVSVVSGIHRGIRRLSELNLILMVFLLLFVIVTGPTSYIPAFFSNSLGEYLQHLPSMSLWVQTGETEWQEAWTIGYWGWWLAWAPFVGIFVARVSRGRTVREFILGVVLAPTLASFVWFAANSGTAMHIQQQGEGDIASVVTDSDARPGAAGGAPFMPGFTPWRSVPDRAAEGEEARPSEALHVMLEHLPWGMFTGVIATLLTTVFFITSSDSGSLVDDMVTSGGHPDPPVLQRVFWAVSEGAIAAVLLVTDGVAALRTSAIAIGFLMGILVIFCCVAIVRALRVDSAAGP